MAPRKSPLSPRKTPRQSRSSTTVDALLVAATRVFKELGYSGATTNRIAVVAGVSIGSLYEYFPNKDALLAALARRHMQEGLEEAARFLAAGTAGGTIDALARSGLHAMLALHDRDVALHRMIFEETALPAWLRRELTILAEPLVDTLTALLKSSAEVRVSDPRLAAILVAQVTESLTHGFVLHPPEGVSRDRFVEEGARLLRAYLTTSG
jgi:AcrR family transcriptional regulator